MSSNPDEKLYTVVPHKELKDLRHQVDKYAWTISELKENNESWQRQTVYWQDQADLGYPLSTALGIAAVVGCVCLAVGALFL